MTVRVQQDFYQPLVPVTKNFRSCFKVDASGAQTMGICTDPQGTGEDREPASAASPRPAAPAGKKPGAPPGRRP